MNNLKQTSYSDLPRIRQHPRFGPISPTTKHLLLVILHVILALAMRNFQLIATLHAMILFLIGAVKALTAKDPKSVIPIVAYIMGAEVLWRMTDAGVFWEFGKYATIAILGIALLRKRKIKNIFLPVLFFLVLTPSIILTTNAFGFSGNSRELISFNLSGALAVSVCILFFKQLEIKPGDLQEWIWPAVYPILGILTLAVYSTLTATEIYFGSESVFITSGGYGPNQVSAALGLGALLLVVQVITGEKKGRFWSILFALALIAQSFLTFSRGGVYNFAIGLVLALIHLLGKPGRFIQSSLVVLIIGLAVILLVIPQLEQFTGGMLGPRFTDLDVASRERLAQADLQLFLDHPVFGVGPGMSSYQRVALGYAAAHTEYTRLLAEHGIGGILALVILIIMLARSYLKAPDAITRVWVVALAAWPLVEMTHSAMRVVAISLTLGLACVRWEKTETEPTDQSPSKRNARFAR